MESHLVTTLAQKDVPACPAAGCIAVFGAFYRLGGADSGFLAQLTPYVNTSGVVRSLQCNAATLSPPLP